MDLRSQTIFSQLMDILPRYEFNKCVERYGGNHKVQSFSCWNQFLCMAFAELTYRESLRDIETCLRVMQNKLYHMGIQNVSRNTLANANKVRDWRIYADFAQVLIAQARALYRNDEIGAELENTVYALDSSTIDLCLSLFPWATFRKRKGAIKLHTLLDLRGNIPGLVIITNGKIHDVNILDQLRIEAGAFYIVDRGYVDFERLYMINQASAFFVTRIKDNCDWRRVYSHPVDKATGVQCDQTIALNGFYTQKYYPQHLRRVRYLDTTNDKRFGFLTNNFALAALTIADLYRCRWQVELFFKWLKQHLRIKKFYGNSENAVKTQIWICIATYVLVLILRRQLGLTQSPYTILQILSVSLFENMPILQAFSNDDYETSMDDSRNQLELFD
jgi:hypothetical protein